MERIPSITPGEILLEEFLTPMNITAYRLAKDTNVPATRISQILKGNRRITADTALRFSKYFGNSAQFWLGLQDDYDLERELMFEKNMYWEHVQQLETELISFIENGIQSN